MKNGVLRIGEKIMLPCSSGKIVPYYVMKHKKGGVYELMAESRFVEPYRRTIVKCQNGGAVAPAASAAA